MSATIPLPIASFTDILSEGLTYSITYTILGTNPGGTWVGPSGAIITSTTCAFSCNSPAEVVSKSNYVNYVTPNDYFAPITVQVTMYDGTVTKNYTETINGIAVPLNWASYPTGTYNRTYNEDSTNGLLAIELPVLNAVTKLYTDIDVVITSTNIPGTWHFDNLETGVTYTSVGNVINFNGITTLAKYNSILTGYLVIPKDYTSSFSYTVAISDGVHTANNISYTVSVTYTDTADVTPLTVASQSYNEDTTKSFALVAMPQIIDAPASGTTPGYTCEVALPASNLGTLGTATPGACIVTWVNPTLTIVGTKNDVNAAIQSLTFAPFADVNVNYTLDIAFTNPGSTQTTHVTILMTGVASDEYNLPAIQNYAEDTTQTFGTPPSIVDNAVSKQYSVTIAANAGAKWTATGTATQTFTGTKSAVNAEIASATWYPDPDYTSAIYWSYSQTQTTDNLIQANAVTFTTQGVDSAETSNASQSFTYTEDTALVLSTYPQIIDVATGKTYTVTVTPNNPYGTFTGAMGTWNGTHWTYTGSKANCNTALSGLTFTPNPDVNANFVAVYTQHQDTDNITQTNANWNFIGVATAETTGVVSLTGDRNTVISWTTPIQIIDTPLNSPTYTVKLIWDIDTGYFTSTNASGNRGTKTWQYSGTKAQCNTELSSVKWYTDQGTTSTVTCQYIQLRDSVTQTNSAFTITINNVNYFTGGTTAQALAEDQAQTSITDLPTVKPYWGYSGYLEIKALDGSNNTQTQVTLISNSVYGNYTGAGVIQIPLTAPITSLTNFQTAINATTILLGADFNSNFTIKYTLVQNSTTVDSVSKSVTVSGSPEYSIPSALVYYEDTDLVLTGSNLFQITDAATSKNYSVTLTLANGAVGAFISGVSSYTPSITITGSKSTVNATLAALKFRGAQDVYSNTTITYTQTQTTDNISQANVSGITLTGNSAYDPIMQLRLINNAGNNVTDIHIRDTSWKIQCDATGAISPVADQINPSSMSLVSNGGGSIGANYNLVQTTPTTGSKRNVYTPKVYGDKRTLGATHTFTASTNGNAPATYGPQTQVTTSPTWNWWADYYYYTATMNAMISSTHTVTGPAILTPWNITGAQTFTRDGTNMWVASINNTKTVNGSNTTYTLTVHVPWVGVMSPINAGPTYYNYKDFTFRHIKFWHQGYGEIFHGYTDDTYSDNLDAVGNTITHSGADLTEYNKISSIVKIADELLWQHNINDNGYQSLSYQTVSISNNVGPLVGPLSSTTTFPVSPVPWSYAPTTPVDGVWSSGTIPLYIEITGPTASFNTTQLSTTGIYFRMTHSVNDFNGIYNTYLWPEPQNTSISGRMRFTLQNP